MSNQAEIDRLTIRQRPSGMPIMYQSWQKLLFMHWPLPPESLRPHIPPQLAIDTYDGEAWIAVAPFTIRKSRPVFLPPIPLLSDFHEMNVRTYVHYDGVPGVWFFSLDASSALAVLGARAAFHLPYYTAQMKLQEEGDEIFYRSRRLHSSGEHPQLEASWRKGKRLGEAPPDSLEFFLVERYCLYATKGPHLFRALIHHLPWTLQEAELITCKSTMITAQGLPDPAGEPLLHYSEIQDTAIWPIRKIV